MEEREYFLYVLDLETRKRRDKIGRFYVIKKGSEFVFLRMFDGKLNSIYDGKNIQGQLMVRFMSFFLIEQVFFLGKVLEGVLNILRVDIIVSEV